jgi:tRNA(Ile)-lysidine synthase
MASSRKRSSARQAGLRLTLPDLQGRRLAVGLSGGMDSVVLLHRLRALAPQLGFQLGALHVHHGLSPNADAWASFCRELCKAWRIPLAVRKVRVARRGVGLEAGARAARRAALAREPADAIALAHHLDDQAETVLLNLLRGAGPRGASAMPAAGRLGSKLLLRPLLAVPRHEILAYARAHGLQWVEDESNRDDALTRNFLRLHVGPLLEARFPRWRENLARAARLFAASDAHAERAMRQFLARHGLRAPSAAKLAEMLKQLTGRGARMRMRHDGKELRAYRGRVEVAPPLPPARFAPRDWHGEARLPIAELEGELRFRRARGTGIDAALVEGRTFRVRLRSGGERLRPDPRRPRRSLKNLFQEAGVPPWRRERLPMLYCGDELVWAPGLGVDAAWQAAARARGIVPEWRGAWRTATRSPGVAARRLPGPSR